MKNQNKSVSRRKFLGSITTAALAAPFLGSSVAGFASSKGRLKHACSGVGGMGGYDLQNVKQHPDVQIVALCDVDANNLKKAAEDFPDARTYTDWRELLEQEHDIIDSVNVTVPDHNHFAIAYRAIQDGKHVYCQKPLCH